MDVADEGDEPEYGSANGAAEDAYFDVDANEVASRIAKRGDSRHSQQPTDLYLQVRGGLVAVRPQLAHRSWIGGWQGCGRGVELL